MPSVPDPRASFTRGWFSEQPRALQDAVLRHAIRRFYDTGAYTHHIGDEGGGLFGLCEGSFGVMVANRRAGLLLGHIFRRGAWFGQGPLLTRKPRGLAFRAMEPSTVLYLPLGAIDLIARELPDARRRLMSLSEYNQATVIEAISELSIDTSTFRGGDREPRDPPTPPDDLEAPRAGPNGGDAGGRAPGLGGDGNDGGLGGEGRRPGQDGIGPGGARGEIGENGAAGGGGAGGEGGRGGDG